jgi:type II secretion system protein I
LKNQKGFTLIEVLVAVAIIGIGGVAFFSGFNTVSKGTFIIDERETAKNLAESQMEYVKTQPYSASYNPSSILSNEYIGYSANISVAAIASRDGNIQKITVTVTRQAKEVTHLDGYKVN